MTRMPALYIPHGGGPSFFMTGERKQMFQQTEDFLRAIDQHLPAKPRAMVVADEVELAAGAKGLLRQIVHVLRHLVVPAEDVQPSPVQMRPTTCGLILART